MLAGRKVLVVEDEPLVAMMVEDMLTDLGYAVIGPAMQLADGIRLAQSEEFDAAVLDINLNGARSFPVADVLQARGIPFLFATGYGGGEALEGRHEPVIHKPYQMERLAEMLTALMRDRAGAVS
jgi:DNA-binding response OmpR family regulator